MWNKKRIKEIVLLSVFLIAAFGIGISSTFLNNQARSPTSAHAAFTFDQYCRNGVYYIKSPKDGSEITCGRAPNCGDTSYTDTANIEWRNNGKCWVEDYFGGDRCKAYCAGYVPLCCYKLAESGDGEDCPFPERKYCRQDQCKQQTKNTDSNCGSGINTYCVKTDHCIADREDVPVLSLADRLAGKTSPGTVSQQPTNTPVPQVPTATPTIKPTSTATPIPPGNNNNGNNNPTSTNIPIPTATHIPTPTTQTNTGDNGGISMNSNTNNNSDFPTSIPTPTTAQTTGQTTEQTTNQNTVATGITSFTMPHIALKSPGEIVKETVTEEKIVKLNEVTDPPLKVAKTTFVSVKSYDQKLENTFRNWIESVRVKVIQFIQ